MPTNQHDLTRVRNLIKMSLELFHKVPAGATEMLFDDQNQPLFKKDDLGKYLGIEDIRHNSRTFHHITPTPGRT